MDVKWKRKKKWSVSVGNAESLAIWSGKFSSEIETEEQKIASGELYLFEQSGNFKVIKMPKRKLLQCAIQSKAKQNTMPVSRWNRCRCVRNYCAQAIVSLVECAASDAEFPFFSVIMESLGLLRVGGRGEI